MSKIFLDKIHAKANKKREERGAGEFKANDPASWKEWLKDFFESAKELRDEFQESGLLNSMTACDRLIERNKKMLNAEDQQYVNQLSAEEFNVQ